MASARVGRAAEFAQAEVLTEAAARYEAALPEGTLWRFPVTRLDDTGVPSWSVTLLPGTPSGGHGYGWTDLKARVGALGELHERLQSALTVPKLPHERASYAELVRVYGPGSVLDPLTLCLEAGSPYTPEEPRLWTPMRRFRDGASVLVPSEAAASSPGELPEGYAGLILPISNGLGAGMSREGAVAHALLELLQRDGNSVSYRALDRGHGLDLGVGYAAVRSEAVRELLARLDALGIEVRVKLAATDFGLVNLYVVGARPGGETPPGMAAACGEACHPDKETALEKALLEFAAARTRLAFNHGPLERVAEIAPEGYLAAYRRAFGEPPEEARALAAMTEWVNASPGALYGALARVFAVSTRTPWAALPNTPDEDTGLKALATRLEGFDLLTLDLASERARSEGVHVVKAVVPGLEVETLSYGRVGARNLARLLARGSELVALGERPARGAAIRLPEAEAARFGPAWLDLDALERTVEGLYPLYREPSRHAVRWRGSAGGGGA